MKTDRDRLLTVDDAAWTDVLARVRHDFYHLPGYVGIEAARIGGRPCAVLVESGDEFLLIPLVIQELPVELDAPADAKDAVSPYGYPGPLLSANWRADGREAGVAIKRAMDVLRLADVCAAFVRLDPLGDYPLSTLAQAGELVANGPTVWCDLTRSDDELWAGTRSTTRNLIRRAARDGFTVEMDDWTGLPDFVSLYRSTMVRVGASESYMFTSGYFDALRSALGSSMHLCTVRSSAGLIVAAGLFTDVNGTVQYHLSGSLESAGRASPTRLMLGHARQWAKARGNARMHFGGGLGAQEDALFAFKAGFSRDRALYRTWRLVTDPTAYADASRRAVGDATGFFPAYRAPRRP